MERNGIEDLLTSFRSDNFSIQSQKEKELRSSLAQFFSPLPNPQASSHPYLQEHSQTSGFGESTNHHLQFSSQINSVKSQNQNGYNLIPFARKKNNTPIGSPEPESYFSANYPNNPPFNINNSTNVLQNNFYNHNNPYYQQGERQGNDFSSSSSSSNFGNNSNKNFSGFSEEASNFQNNSNQLNS